MTKRKPTLSFEAAEYEAGYLAFMACTTFFAMGHAEMDENAWANFHRAGIDYRPETDSYVEGWKDAQAQMLREVGTCFGARKTARALTATMRRQCD
jgi:hypothetical protein